MKRAAVAGLSMLLGLPVLVAVAEPVKLTAAAVLAEFDRMAEFPLWPGFDPKRVPLAIYDSERTVLVRHPSPPPEFKKEGGLWIYAGQHSGMRANTSTELGGVTTATLLLDPQRGRDARKWASVLTHETFHVFQRERHPTWSGNEAELFTYPLDAGRLAARRLESEAFRRALAAKDLKDVVCWSGKALDLRRQRYASLPAGSVAYERGTELNEGLAAFVENLALGDPDGPDLPAGEHAAEDIRNRAYAIGAAQAALLDRLDPGWRKALEEGQGANLDEMLARALAGKPASPCALSPEESAAAAARAREDLARLFQEKQKLRETFLGRPRLEDRIPLRGAASLAPGIRSAERHLSRQGRDPSPALGEARQRGQYDRDPRPGISLRRSGRAPPLQRPAQAGRHRTAGGTQDTTGRGCSDYWQRRNHG